MIIISHIYCAIFALQLAEQTNQTSQTIGNTIEFLITFLNRILLRNENLLYLEI